MNIHSVLLWPLLTLAVLSAGCATKRPKVETWCNPQYSLTRADTFALTDRPNPSRKDARFGSQLVAELQREGFALVSAEQADWLLTYVVSDNFETAGAHVSVLSPPPPSVMPGNVAMSGMWAASVPPTVYVTPVIYHTKALRLYLYTNPHTHSGNFQMVWQGSIAADLTASPERELVLLKTLLVYLGKEQNGRVDLVP